MTRSKSRKYYCDFKDYLLQIKNADGNPIPISKQELEEAVEEKILPLEILDPDSVEDLCSL